jgi:predicted component of type VI protein secretion system
MKSKWAEVESKVKDRKTLYIDQRQFAKILEDTVADVKKS